MYFLVFTLKQKIINTIKEWNPGILQNKEQNETFLKIFLCSMILSLDRCSLTIVQYCLNLFACSSLPQSNSELDLAMYMYKTIPPPTEGT